MMKIIPALDNFSHLFLCRPCSRFRTGGHSDGHSHAQGRRWNRQHGWRVRRWETTLQLGQMCKTNSVSYETLSCFLDYVCVMWFSDTNRDSFFFNHKAQTATFKESQLKSAWMCLLLTAQNHNCSRLPWSQILRYVKAKITLQKISEHVLFVCLCLGAPFRRCFHFICKINTCCCISVWFD